MVFSNREPEFDNTNAHIRRLIYCYPIYDRKYKVDPKFYDKLKAELPQILYKCRELYYELTDNHGPIECDVEAAMQIGDEKDFDKEAFFDEYFKLDESKHVRAKDLHKFIQNNEFKNFNYTDFIHYLSIKYGIRKTRLNSKNNRIWVYDGITLKGSNNE